MAYIFDPIQNTFIDDEDTSLGNKLALNTDEFQKLLDIPGVFKASDAPQPPVRPDVQEIELFNRFNRENPEKKTEGGNKLQSKEFLLADATTEMDQAPDSFLRPKRFDIIEGKELPAETLEDFDVTFRKPNAKGGRVNLQAGTNVMTLNPVFPEKSTNFMLDEPKLIDVPGGFILPAGISLGAKRLSDIFFSKDEEDQKDLMSSEDKTPGSSKPPPKGPDFTETIGLELLKEAVQNREYGREGFFENINKLSKEQYGGNLKQTVSDLTGVTDKKQLNNVYTQIVNAARRKGFKFDAAGMSLESNIPQSKVPLDLNALTNTLRTSPNVLDNRVKELNLDLNKVYNRKELQDIVGVTRDVDKRKDNFFMELLQDQGLEYKDLPGGRKGFIGQEVIDALKDYSKNKIRNYESRSYSGSLRKKSTENLNVRKKIEGADYINLQSQINKSFTRTLLNEDLYLPNSVAEFGHNPVPVALTEKIKMLNNPELAKKIFSIQNQTWQGKEINYDTLMRTSGTLEKTLKGLDKFYNKKITKNNIKEVTKLSKELDNYYNSVVEKAGEAVDDLPFHKEVIGKLNLKVPKIGEKLTAENFNVDMSGVDKRFIIGNIDLINPNATSYSDLTLGEKEEFGQNIIDQKILQIKEFYGPRGANFPQEIINDFIEKLEFGTSEVMGMAEREGLGKVTKADGGPIELSSMPRVDFNGGGAAGADDTFAKELEYYFLNPNTELPKAQTYKETMNPIELVNDIIDPRNIPYYADVLLRSGIRVGEFAGRLLPALGELASDLMTKPAFKITGGGNYYVRDYDEIPPINIEGQGLFMNFLKNITPTGIEKASGLAELIEKEEQKQKDRRSTVGPKILADTVGLGIEVGAPIFPGLKLLRAYAKDRGLPKDNVTKDLLEKEVDEVLSSKGMNRREFLAMTGAGATVAMAKLLGIGGDVAAPVATKAATKTATGASTAPAYFFNLVQKIQNLGDDVTTRYATKEREKVIQYKDYELTEDLDTGRIQISKKNMGYDERYGEGIVSEEYMSFTPGRADETTGGKKVADEYEENTGFTDKDGKLKDVEPGVSEETVQEGTIFEDNITDFRK